MKNTLYKKLAYSPEGEYNNMYVMEMLSELKNGFMNSNSEVYKHSFFRRLLGAFLLVGTGPILIVSVLVIGGTSVFFGKTYEERGLQAITAAAVLARHLISEAEEIAVSLAEDSNVIRYLSSGHTDTLDIMYIRQRIAQKARDDYYDVFILPADGSPLYTGMQIPEQYGDSAYRGWGLMGQLSRRESNRTDRDEISFYSQNADITAGRQVIAAGQPHPGSKTAPIAIGIPVLHDNAIAGYIVIDILRKAFSDQIGVTAGREGAFTNLFILDHSGCILYSMIDAEHEALFLDETDFGPGQFISQSQSISKDFSIMGTYPVSAVYDFSHRVQSVTLAIVLCTAAAALIVTMAFSRSIAKPVHLLTVSMRKVESGDLAIRCPDPRSPGRGDELSFLVWRFNSMVEKIQVLVEDTVLKQSLLKDAEIKALQSQINPHFLCNTLNSIRSIAKLSGADDIAAMTTSLARILHKGLLRGDDMTTLNEALEMAKDYFLIESYRWPDRFTFEEDISPDILDTVIPRLIIQPIVENALTHGLESRSGPGVLSISGMHEADNILIIVSDDGIGMNGAELERLRGSLIFSENDTGTPRPDPAGDFTKSSGIALVNAHRRLKLLYGRDAGISVYSFPGAGTSVTITLPYQKGGTDD